MSTTPTPKVTAEGYPLYQYRSGGGRWLSVSIDAKAEAKSLGFETRTLTAYAEHSAQPTEAGRVAEPMREHPFRAGDRTWKLHDCPDGGTCERPNGGCASGWCAKLSVSPRNGPDDGIPRYPTSSPQSATQQPEGREAAKCSDASA